MPIAVACNDCGKVYSVSSAMVGKRVKCKACGHTFSVGQPILGKTVAKPVFTTTESSVGTFSAGLSENAFTLPTSRLILWLKPSTWFILACLVAAIIIGLTVRQEDRMWSFACGFLIVAGVFFLVTAIAATITGLQTPGHFKLPRRDVLRVLTQLTFVAVQGALSPLPFIVYKHVRLNSSEFGPFYYQLVVCFLKSLAIAGLFVVVLATGVYEDWLRPHSPNALESAVTDHVFVKETEQRLVALSASVANYQRWHRGIAPSAAELQAMAPWEFFYSPFSLQSHVDYVYLPQNIGARSDDRIIAFDPAELDLRGLTHAVTNSGKILTLSKDDLSARGDVPH